ncbi:MAG: hypothetical protein AAB539_02935 [Patescibacteria group bacterium]
MQRGFLVLISILILAGIGVAVAVALLFLGIDATRTAGVSEKAAHARALASTCAEIALRVIKDTPGFSGYGPEQLLGQGQCGYQIINTGGENRSVYATGTVGSVIRRSKVIVSVITPEITIDSWQEVVDF